jgi:hypothetical protein
LARAARYTVILIAGRAMFLVAIRPGCYPR